MRFLFLITILLLTAVPAAAQTNTTITYQGQLQDPGGPVTSTLDMEFRLFDSLADGNQIGTEIVLSAVPVTDGLFQVELDFGAPYGAEPTYLEVMVGNEVLAPRQSVSAAPLAIHALSLDAAYADNRFWKLGGNAGTTPGTDILGTTDNTPLELHVNGQRALRLEPIDTASPNLIGGSESNTIFSGMVGTTIAGGSDHSSTGSYSTIGGGSSNSTGDFYTTVGGGVHNDAVAYISTIGGGSYNEVLAAFGVIAGGGPSDTDNSSSTHNVVYDEYGTISGGGNNQAGSNDGDAESAIFATIGGGDGNTASGAGATVGGGDSNKVSGIGATVGGGSSNTANGSRATVGGGAVNTASGRFATVPGGVASEATKDYTFAAGRRAKANHQGAFVWADSGEVDFASTGDDQFLVHAAGGVGIGTNNPDRDLHIKQRSTNNGQIGLQIERSGASTNNWGLYIATSDNLGFRYNDVLKSRIDADDGVYSTSSDRNAKKDIQALSGVLSRVLKLKPRTYLMKEQDESAVRSPGFIAQEVEPLFPATVTVQDGEYALKYSQITVLNTAALIELNAQFSNTMTSLESESQKRFAALESENADLRSRVTALSDDKRQMQALADRNRALAAIQALHDENRMLESRLSELETELEAQSLKVADLKSENTRLLDMAQSNRELEQRLATLEALLLDQRLAQKEGQ